MGPFHKPAARDKSDVAPAGRPVGEALPARRRSIGAVGEERAWAERLDEVKAALRAEMRSVRRSIPESERGPLALEVRARLLARSAATLPR